METLVEQNIEGRLVAFICRNFMVEPGEFSLEESLVDQGVIDSFGLVESSAFMEREFGVIVAQTDMNRANFGSVKKMVAFIARRGTL
jgi:acyl carrier protein